jgi:hypothetical protein
MANTDRAFVRNAADPEQVKRASERERRREHRFVDALRVVMQAPSGRIVMWELIGRAKVHESIWDQSARIHYNAGRQDYGHELMAALVSADEDLYLLMEREMRAWQRGENATTDATHAARADEQGDQQ